MKYAQLLIGMTLGIFISFSTISVAKDFPDVSATDWFQEYVQKIEQWGIISGNDDGTFAPGREVVRAELAKMFVLLDERTDNKIQISEAGTQLAINEGFKALEEENFTEDIPTTMQLRKRNNPVASCPENWTEIDSGIVGNDNSRLNTRSCLTPKKCEVLRITKHSSNPPKDCPSGWMQADYGLVEAQDMERVCFICAS